MKPIFSTTPIVNRIFALVLIGLGAAGIGLQARWLSQRGVYLDYSSVVTSTTGLQTMGATLDAAVAGGAVVLVAGLIALAGGSGATPKIRNVYKFGLGLAVFGGLIQLGAGIAIMVNPFYNAMGPQTYIANENFPNSTLSGSQEKMALFGLAMFSQCCHANGWESLGPFAACGVACPTDSQIIDRDLLKFTNFFDDRLLCTCVRNDSSTEYNSYLNAFGTDQCNTMKNVQLDFDPNLIIPTSCELGICLPLSTIKGQLYPNTKIVKVPLVGYQLDPESSNGQAQPGFGFGCGLGYQKGVMWFQQVYHDQSIMPGGSTAIGVGVVSAIFPVLVTLLGWFLSREDKDMGDKWEDTLAARWHNDTMDVPVAKVAAPAATTNAKVDTAAWSAPPIPAYQVSANDYTDQLIKFYSKHDPNKTQKEIEGIANWGKQHGLDALNKKLMEKYGVDLSGGDSGPPI